MARAGAVACTRVFIEIDGGEPMAVKWYGTPTVAEISTNVRRVAGLRDDAPLDVRGECTVLTSRNEMWEWATAEPMLSAPERKLTNLLRLVWSD
jgi:hypothetical protein